jgi:hypothetical protein
MLAAKQKTMNSPSRYDAASESLPVWPPTLSNERTHQSLFSLLLEIENRLRAEERAKQRKRVPGKNHKRPEHLSRYIE